MDPASGIIKIVAAFVAGLVIALGGTLIYVKTSALIHPRQEVVRSPLPTAAPPEPAPDPVVSEPVPEESVPAPAPAPKAVRHAPAPKPVKKRPVVVASANAPRPPAPVIAQNTPPPAPEPVPQQPAVAEPQPPPAVSAPEPAPPVRQPKVITLAAGTQLPVRLGETLSTDHNYNGDTFRGSLDQPIIVDGLIIADKGSKVLDKIVESDRAGRVRGTSNIRLVLTDINTTDGQRVRVETGSWEKQGNSSRREDAAKIAGGAALGAIIGAVAGGGKGAAIGAGAGGAAGTGVVLGTRGHETVVPSETRITFQLDTPVTITEQLN